MKRLDEVRRLTGRTVWLDRPGVGAELVLDDTDEPAAVLAGLQAAVHIGFAAWGVDVGPLLGRMHRAGISLAMAAPDDVLHTAADALETLVRRVLGLAPTDDEQAALDERDNDAWRAAFAQESSPALLALLSAAPTVHVPVLHGDDAVTIGLGVHSRTYPLTSLPSPTEVPWEDLGRIPVALVTGTNGKTTTTRLLARMGEEAGHQCGYTTTDGLVIAGEEVSDGDWSGPGGARSVLRDERVQFAVLETARGGMLRRGLALTEADVAIITNVSADHLGEYGIYDAPEMAAVKCLVAKGLRAGGSLVLNGDDDVLMGAASQLPNSRVLFSRRGQGEALASHLAWGGEAWTLENDVLVHRQGPTRRTPWLPVAELPMTFQGTAGFNVENLMAATAAAVCLGLP
ncbi:MAG: Mur ligase family protein, partial [Myxococcota bacterium]